MEFFENNTAGRPALALIATTAKRVSLNGRGGEHNAEVTGGPLAARPVD